MTRSLAPPISDYAIVGDTRTAALISSSGSIDWMCVPNFDGQPLFGRLLGDKSAFAVSVDGVVESRRGYRQNSAVLETVVKSETGTGRRIDAMVVNVSGRLLPQMILVRRIDCDQGSLRVRINFDPKLGLPGRAPRLSRRAGAFVCEWGPIAIGLQASSELELEAGKEAIVDINEGSALTLVMTLSDRAPLLFVPPETATALVEETDSWWHEWVGSTGYHGPFPDFVVRSLITLQLLTFAPSGAPVAAPTTSLPEVIGGTRN